MAFGPPCITWLCSAIVWPLGKIGFKVCDCSWGLWQFDKPFKLMKKEKKKKIIGDQTAYN